MIYKVRSDYARGKMRNENGTLKIVRSCVSLRASVKSALEFMFAYTLSRVSLLTVLTGDRTLQETSKVAFCVRRTSISLPSQRIQPSATILLLFRKTRYVCGRTGTESYTSSCRERREQPNTFELRGKGVLKCTQSRLRVVIRLDGEDARRRRLFRSIKRLERISKQGASLELDWSFEKI